MPGKPFRSSLEPHYEEIAQRRARRETWAGIAAELEKAHGLKVHFSAVQKFFGRHLARPRPLGFEPLPTAATATATAPTDAPTTSAKGGKKYVFTPKDKRPSRFSDEDLQFNDPLALGDEQTPVDPDAENPFKMRKRKAI